jgi:hypothetical protein
MLYSNLENKAFISRHVVHQLWYICPIALPVRRKPQHRSVLAVVSATFSPSRASSATFERPWENFSIKLWTALCDKTLPTVKRKHFFMNILCIVTFCPEKTHNRRLLFGSKILNHGSHFDHWNQPLNVRMRVCYLDCHEAGLCCYLVIQIENLLRPLQLFYFHLWPIYWLPSITAPWGMR